MVGVRQILKSEDKLIYILLVVGFVLGIISVILVNMHIKSIEKRYTAGKVVEIAVASRSLRAGSKISKGDISFIKLPADQRPGGVVERRSVDYVIEKTLKINLEPGDPILWGAIGTGIEEGMKRFSERLKKGWRVITLSVDEISGLNGFIKPSDRVDIWGTFTIMEGNIAVVKTLLVLQNITVVAVDRETDPNTPLSTYRNITLLVSPEDAELLYHAMDRGRLFFSLRNPEDDTILNLPGIDFKTFVNRIKPRVVSTDELTPSIRQEKIPPPLPR